MKKKLVVLHGWGQNKSYWEDFTNRISTEIDVEVIDLPGFGNEPIVSVEWGIPEYSQWVNERISRDIKGDEKVVLLGHSFGGRISSYLASQNPNYLSALILYGSPSLYRPSSKVKRKIALYKSFGKVIPRSLSKRFYSDDLVASAEIGMEKVFRNVVTFDQSADLPKIAVETLLVWGENDDSVPIHIAEEMQSLTPNSQLKVLPDLGHNAHIENPTLFYGTIKNFIQNLK